MHAWRKSGAPWDRGDAREDEGEEKGKEWWAPRFKRLRRPPTERSGLAACTSCEREHGSQQPIYVDESAKDR